MRRFIRRLLLFLLRRTPFWSTEGGADDRTGRWTVAESREGGSHAPTEIENCELGNGPPDREMGAGAEGASGVSDDGSRSDGIAPDWVAGERRDNGPGAADGPSEEVGGEGRATRGREVRAWDGSGVARAGRQDELGDTGSVHAQGERPGEVEGSPERSSWSRRGSGGRGAGVGSAADDPLGERGVGPRRAGDDGTSGKRAGLGVGGVGGGSEAESSAEEAGNGAGSGTRAARRQKKPQRGGGRRGERPAGRAEPAGQVSGGPGLQRRAAITHEAYAGRTADVGGTHADYAAWNEALGARLVGEETRGERFLSVTPGVLGAMWKEGRQEMVSTEEAGERFAEAVSTMYGDRVLGHPDGLHILRRVGRSGVPDCIGLLALSVLAAYQMRSDDEAAGHAYYIRLARLLKCSMGTAYPRGFKPEVFESLWLFSAEWLRREHGLGLALPHADVGLRRFVALPLAHVPLRQLDIEKLPAFFVWARYESGEKRRTERVLQDLKTWQRSRAALTAAGEKALGDSRADAVAAQVQAELEAWDGCAFDIKGRRSAAVKLFLDVVRRQPQLYYLAPRPMGFPQVFDGGGRRFELSEEGWYNPVRVAADDGSLLLRGFEWQADGVSGSVLRRDPAQVIVLGPSESWSGFVSRRGLPRGVACAVLCAEDAVAVARGFLEKTSKSECRPVRDRDLPVGWSLFENVMAKLTVTPPDGFGPLQVDDGAKILISGGLRLGRRQAWIRGAPPKVIVAGLEAGRAPMINGAAAGIGNRGELCVGELLAESGVHTIEAGQLRRRVEIVEATVSERAKRLTPTREETVVLPVGQWVLVGDRPDQVAYPTCDHWGGVIAACPFRGRWAIDVGGGPGATVLCLSDPPPPLDPQEMHITRQNRRRCGTWAARIYDAHVRRPRLGALDLSLEGPWVRRRWAEYAVAARALKRRLRKLQ